MRTQSVEPSIVILGAAVRGVAQSKAVSCARQTHTIDSPRHRHLIGAIHCRRGDSNGNDTHGTHNNECRDILGHVATSTTAPIRQWLQRRGRPRKGTISKGREMHTVDNDNKVEQYDSNNTATFAETVSARHQRRGQLDQYEPVDDLHSTAPSDYEHKAEGLDAAPSAATPHRHSGLRPIGRRMSVTTPPLSRERCLCDTIGVAELNQNELVGNLTLEWSQGRPSLSIATRTPRGRWCGITRTTTFSTTVSQRHQRRGSQRLKAQGGRAG